MADTTLLERLAKGQEALQHALREASEERKAALGKLQALEKALDTLTTKVDRFRGETNERLLREKVAEAHGVRFSQRFMIHGLGGLARLVAPRKQVSEYFTCASPTAPGRTESDLDRQAKARDKLTQAAYQVGCAVFSSCS